MHPERKSKMKELLSIYDIKINDIVKLADVNRTYVADFINGKTEKVSLINQNLILSAIEKLIEERKILKDGLDIRMKVLQHETTDNIL